MVRNTTRAALVVLAIVSVAGLSTVGFGADADVATGRAAASGPLTTEIELTTTELLTTTESTTATTTEVTVTTTEATATTTATRTTTTTATTTITDDSPVGTTTVSDSVTNDTEEATNETGDAVNETGDAVNETKDAINETTNDTEEVTNETGDLTNETSDLTNATVDSMPVVTGGPTDAIVVSADGSSTRLSVAATSSLVATSSDTLVDTVTSSLDGKDDEGSTTRPSSGDGQADGDDRTTTASDETTATDRQSGTTTGLAGDSSAEDSSAESDAPQERSEPPTPSSPEVAVSVGALTAAALLPQLADGLAFVGNAGLVSASSVFVGPTRSRGRRSVGSLFDRFWRFVTPFRYSRWDDSDPLDHAGRRALYEAIERSPGAYLSAVCESAEVPVSTARHHLDVLEDEGLVTTVKVRGKRRYYPGRGEDAELVAALEDEGTAPVLHALARLGDAHGGLLADELDRDPSTVSHHLSRLEDAGLVEREREGRAVVNRLTPEVRKVLLGDEETDAEADDETDPETETETPAIAD